MREDRWMYQGLVRVHLVINGWHVGYLVVEISAWIDFLEHQATAEALVESEQLSR